MKLFKYKPIDRNCLDMIVREYLYMASPKQLNDPTDCKRKICYPEMEITHEFPISICSFSEKNDDPILWSHYADSHKGICIEYNFQKITRYYNEVNDLFSRTNDTPKKIGKYFLDKVIYDENLKFADHSHFKMKDEDYIEIALKKTKYYEIEDEVRLYCVNNGNHHFKAKDSIKNIYLGHFIDKKDRDMIVEIIEMKNKLNESNKIQIYKVIQINNKGMIEFDKL